MSFSACLRVLLARRRVVRYRTMFGMARVYEIPWEGTRVRALKLRGTLQSATYVDERWCDPPFPYLRHYDCMYDAGVPIRDVCMLGGGGYAYPKHVVAHHPNTRIDVVEIDPRITRIARDHFYLDIVRETYRTDATDRLGLICDDALSYLESCARAKRRYDAILNDCFAANEPEQDMVTPRAAQLVRACLNPGGLYLANIISAIEGEDAEPLMELVVLLSAEFSHVMVLPSDRCDADEEDNVLVVATNGPASIPGTLPFFDRT